MNKSPCTSGRHTVIVPLPLFPAQDSSSHKRPPLGSAHQEWQGLDFREWASYMGQKGQGIVPTLEQSRSRTQDVGKPGTQPPVGGPRPGSSHGAGSILPWHLRTFSKTSNGFQRCPCHLLLEQRKDPNPEAASAPPGETEQTTSLLQPPSAHLQHRCPHPSLPGYSQDSVLSQSEGQTEAVRISPFPTARHLNRPWERKTGPLLD